MKLLHACHHLPTFFLGILRVAQLGLAFLNQCAGLTLAALAQPAVVLLDDLRGQRCDALVPIKDLQLFLVSAVFLDLGPHLRDNPVMVTDHYPSTALHPPPLS